MKDIRSKDYTGTTTLDHSVTKCECICAQNECYIKDLSVHEQFGVFSFPKRIKSIHY